MKRLLNIMFITISIKAFGQQPLKTYNGAYIFENNEGTATFTYLEQKGEIILEGNFSFNYPTENITVNGKYSKGKKSGLWTRKQVYSRYNGMAAVKNDLRWHLVTENTPFKEVTEVTTENYVNDMLEGVSTKTKTVKNSWGNPAPGGNSTSVFIVKKTFAEDVMIAIEGIRKKNEKVNLSFKGTYKKEVAEGNWIFNDNKNTYSYNFDNGYLINYEIKELGTAKIIETNKVEIDNDLINSYFVKSENNFEVVTGDKLSDLKEAKLMIQKINENLTIIKLCKLRKKAADFVNLDVRLFSNAFGIDVTPYKNDDFNEFAYSPLLKCEVLNENNYSLFNNIYFNDIKTEYAFLNAATNNSGQFLNTNWDKFNDYHDARYLYQLKYYLYKGDTVSLKGLLNKIKDFNFNFNTRTIEYDGKYSTVGNSYAEYFEYLNFLINLSLGETEKWKSFIDSKYNGNSFGKAWQSIIPGLLNEIQENTKFVKFNIDEIISYLKVKEDEIKSLNNEFLSSFKELKIGNQIWMDRDLNLIPTSQYYTLVTEKEIMKKYVGKGLILFALRNNNKSICPEGWRIPKKADWTTLIKTLGGDENLALKMLKVGGGSGFESNFPMIYEGSFQTGAEFYSGYLSLDENGDIAYFDFNNRPYFSTNGNPPYLPCRCIKE